MFLYLARHAWAGSFGDPGWADDSLRELTDEGAERYQRVVEALAERGFAPQRIATSPYVRCRQTAEIISKYTPHQPEIEELDALAPGSDLSALIAWTAAGRGADACWCGHNPDMPALLGALLDAGGPNLRFAKGSIAAVRFYDEVAPGLGELNWHVTAKVLGL